MEETISVNSLRFIIDQMKKSVIKIKNENYSGTGFLCSIPFHNKILPVLVTCNHILSEVNISLGKKIHFSLNNDQQFFKILIDKTRKVYTNKEYDITFIEIKQNDGFDISSFIEVDQNLLNANENELVDKSVYLLGYPYGKESNFSSGSIKKILGDGKISHLCPTSTGCAGGPILNRNNYKVIAVHEGAIKDRNYNIGVFLKNPIEEFNKLN